MEQESKSRRTAITLVILVVVTLLIVGAVVLGSQSEDNGVKNTPRQSVSQTKSTNRSSTSQPTSSFKSGTYDASGRYQSPGGEQEIKVSVTLGSDGTIVDTSAEGDNKSSDSKFYQSSFISNYKTKVVGKKIGEIKLDHVGASSLTSQGFNDALEEIKSQAKA